MSWSDPAETPNSGAEAAYAKSKYGITTVTVRRFHYKQFQYTKLEDAIAQAERDLIVRTYSPLAP